MKTNGTNYLKPNIQLFADGGDDSAATGETTPATATAASTASVSDGNGTQATTTAIPAAQTETQPFKSFASEADYQKEIDFRITQALKTHEEKLKGKLTPEIRKQLEAEANMTAEQKYQAQLDQLEADKKALAKEKVRIKAESLFSAKGISEADRAVMLDSIVDDDEEGSLKRAQALIDAIEKATNEKIKAAMAQVKAPGTVSGTHEPAQPKENIGKIIGHQYAEARKGASKAIDYYKVGGNRS